MGVHDIERKFEPHRIVMEVDEFFIHPDWDPFNQNYDSDIAVMKTTHQIQFTEFIQAICLWESEEIIPATSGIAIGYGPNGQTTVNNNGKRIAKKLQVFMHNNDECVAAEPRLKILTSNRTLCGESSHGSTICFGDSGHGFFVRLKNKFFLRGIISSSPKGANSSCTLTNYGVYTNVQKYKHWIDKPERFHRNSDICGIMSSAVPLIQGERIAIHVQFPWTVLIKYPQFYYTGVLLSQRHVLSYSGSFSYWDDCKGKYIPQALNEFKLLFGLVDVNNQDDPNVISVNPARVILHPHLQKINGIAVNAVGIAVLETSVPFNKFIKPICLWNDQHHYAKDMKLFSNGYGKDDTGKFSTLRKYARMTFTSHDVCRATYSDRPSAFEYTKLFCAQGSNVNETPCEGDIPLIMKSDDKWFIRGIMINYRLWKTNGTCVFNKPLLYEDVAHHAHWIQAQTLVSIRHQ